MCLLDCGLLATVRSRLFRGEQCVIAMSMGQRMTCRQSLLTCDQLHADVHCVLAKRAALTGPRITSSLAVNLLAL